MPTTAEWRNSWPDEFTISGDKIQAMIHGERGLELAMKESLNQFLQCEITEHVGVGGGEHTKYCRDYRSVSSKLGLPARVSILEQEVLRDRECIFKKEFSERYQEIREPWCLLLWRWRTKIS